MVQRNADEIKRLNLGAGDNPMPGAVNVDLDPRAPGVMQADANNLPFDAQSFDEVHAVNPFGFNPVNAETARVLKPGGTLQVSGQTLGPRPNKNALPVSPPPAGFSPPTVTPMVDAHKFGTQKTTSGQALDTTRSTTSTYVREADG